MAKLTLKNLLGKKHDASELVNTLLDQLQSTVFIEDATGKILLGEFRDQTKYQYPVVLDEEILGFVKGDEQAMLVTNLLTYLVQKEAERKKLGSEILNLYQEVNLIFDFSERLAQTIDATSIAQVTLEEANRVIKSNNGVVILWDDDARKLQTAAVIGELFFDPEKINAELPLLRTIIFNGQSEIINDVSALKEVGVIRSEVQSVIYSALKVKHRIMGAIILASDEPVLYMAADLKLLTTLALQSSAAIESALLYEKNIREANEREEAMRQVYEVAGKFVPYEFIRSLGREVITDVRLGDQVEKIVTVLFSDIREYTTLSEKMTPEENFSFVCSFNGSIGPIIRRHNGFINQYLGDAIMAIFPGSAADALAAAVEMQKEVAEFNKKREAINEPPIQIGVGMHTGPLIMGITGDIDRMDACTISDTVNTASRIESLTKHYKASVILSDATLEQITRQDEFLLRGLGLVQLKGKQASVRIHECFSGNPDLEKQMKKDTLPVFNEAVSYYLDESFHLANKSFQKVMEDHPEDRTARFFYTYTKQIIEKGFPDNKAGIMEMSEK